MFPCAEAMALPESDDLPAEQLEVFPNTDIWGFSDVGFLWEALLFVCCRDAQAVGVPLLSYKFWKTLTSRQVTSGRWLML